MTAATATLSPRAAWALVLVATATMAVSYVDRQALAVLAPTVTASLGISNARFGDLVSAFSIAYLICTPLAGRFIDGVGARRGLLVSVLIWSTVAAGHAFAAGFSSLFALRILLGAAEAPSFPAAAQTVARALPPKDRGAGFGILFTGSSLGAMVAAPLASMLAVRYGWRWAMVGTAGVGLAWVPLWLLVTSRGAARELLGGSSPRAPEGPAAVPASRFALLREPAVIRAVCAVLATAPTATFVLNWGAKVLVAMHGITQGEVGRYMFLPPLLFDLGAVAFGALATARERRRGRDEPPRLLFALAALLTVVVAACGLTASPWTTTVVIGVGLAGTGAVFALLTAELLRRVEPARAATAGGLTAAAQSLAYIVANPLIGRLSDRRHSFAAVAVGLGLWVLPGTLVWLLWRPAPRR